MRRPAGPPARTACWCAADTVAMKRAGWKASRRHCGRIGCSRTCRRLRRGCWRNWSAPDFSRRAKSAAGRQLELIGAAVGAPPILEDAARHAGLGGIDPAILDQVREMARIAATLAAIELEREARG